MLAQSAVHEGGLPKMQHDCCEIPVLLRKLLWLSKVGAANVGTGTTNPIWLNRNLEQMLLVRDVLLCGPGPC